MQKKITKLMKRYCKPDLDIKLVFTIFKLRNLFGVKCDNRFSAIGGTLLNSWAAGRYRDMLQERYP